MDLLTNLGHDVGTIRRLFACNSPHPSGLPPVALVRAPDGEPLQVIYYHCPELLTITEVTDEDEQD